MAEPKVEAAWRNEFKRVHTTEPFGSVNVPNDPKATFGWSGDEAETQRLKEEHAHHYLRWTFFGAVAVVIVGLIGVALSFVN
jgi:hypothetical protein